MDLDTVCPRCGEALKPIAVFTSFLWECDCQNVEKIIYIGTIRELPKKRLSIGTTLKEMKTGLYWTYYGYNLNTDMISLCSQINAVIWMFPVISPDLFEIIE